MNDDQYETMDYDMNEVGTLNLKRNVIVKMYAPAIFKKIRNLSGVTDEDLLESLEPSKNIK